MGTGTSYPTLRALRGGAWLVLVATIVSVSIVAWQCAMYPLDTNHDAVWIQRMVNALPSNSTAVAAVGLCWLLAHLAAQCRPLAVVGVALAAALLLGLLPRAHRTWNAERFTPETYAAFAQWREIIPETSEVLWPRNSTGVWVLLERRSYMSDGQLAGLLYSPRMTAEVLRRTESLEPLVPPGWWTLASRSKQSEPRALTPFILRQVCRPPGPGYVVDAAAIDGYVAKAMFPVERVRVYLYDCQVVNSPDSAT
jgi:hypothetical protein